MWIWERVLAPSLKALPAACLEEIIWNEIKAALNEKMVKTLEFKVSVLSIPFEKATAGNGVYSIISRTGKWGPGHAQETRDAQFMQWFTQIALIGVTPARPQVCKCPPPERGCQSVAIFMNRRH